MDIRYAANPRDVKRYTTEELRKEFLIENLYVPDSVVAVYSHVRKQSRSTKELMYGPISAPTISWSAGRSASSISAVRAAS